jgi:hypothetical protein
VRRVLSRILVVVTALAAVMLAANGARADAKPNPSDLQPGAITIDARPITSFNRLGSPETRFGRLDFLGGLVLTSPDSRHFGGWSGLILDADGKDFAAVSDSGLWLTGSIAYANGKPAAIKDARLGPLLALDGKPLKRNRDRDAEAIALVSGSTRKGTVLIAFEQNSRLARHEVSSAGVSRALQLLERPRGANDMRRNKGFEAMTVMRGGPHKGLPVAISERLYNASRNHTGWIWTPRGALAFHVTNIGDFDITDIASQDDGTFYILERRFRWLDGIKMRIRQFDAAALAPGKTLDGETLIEANLEYEIDNMEGLAISRGPNRETILTLLSDDNYNRTLQRTLLLQFKLGDVETAKTRPTR